MNSETKIHSTSSVSTTCQNCKKDFTIEPEDFKFYEKIKVPAPTFCPECRIIRRYIIKNDRSLYKIKCDASGHQEQLISMYSSEEKLFICDRDYWWSDDWDSMEYGKNYDFNKSFFEQFHKLQSKVPRPSLVNNKAVNSAYCNFADENKNCYLLTTANRNEDSFFGFFLADSKNVSDSIFCSDSELLYECIDCQKCYNLRYSQECKDCVDSVFLVDCKGCTNCLFCIGLRSKSYQLFNKPISKEEYHTKIKEIFGSYKKLQEALKKFKEIKKEFPIRKANNFIACKNTSGDFIFQSKNINHGFDVYDSENASYLQAGLGAKDAYDITSFDKAEFSYESLSLMGYGYFFSIYCRDSRNITYCDNCHACSDCFGCVGLRHKQYCILNKQYTKEQYEELVSKIIKQMNDLPYISPRKNPKTGEGQVYKYGEFFPPELSPFYYNETIAQEYFPLTKEEALKQGYRWKEREERNYTIDIKNEDIPDNISEVDESIINKVIECGHKGTCNEQCTEAFKIIPEELSFYQRMNLPLPRLCSNCRHYQRLKQRNPLKLWHRHCMKPNCSNEFETSYSPDRPEIIYCESCYNKEIY
jgi:hypothetical protein